MEQEALLELINSLARDWADEVFSMGTIRLSPEALIHNFAGYLYQFHGMAEVPEGVLPNGS